MIKKILLFGVLLFLSCKGSEKEAQKEKKDTSQNNTHRKINVTIEKISSSLFHKQFIANGVIVALQKTELRFKTNNIISKIGFLNGQKVGIGNTIVALENDLLKNDLEKKQIELQKAQNKLQEERINFDDDKLTPQVLKNLQIKSGVLEARNNLKRAQLEYEQTLLKAPFSGVIANIEKKEGDYITTSDVFCTLINPDKIEVSFSVLENEYDFVSKGDDIEIHSFSNDDAKFKGVVTEINPLVDKNGLIKIKAKIISKKTGLLDGMHVKVIVNKPLRNVITIPKEALVLRSNKEVVFTYKNGMAKWNYVEIAGENTNSYAIKKGLQITDTLIVSGNSNLAHDAKVKATFTPKEKRQK